jgi:hypothetical protein
MALGSYAQVSGNGSFLFAIAPPQNPVTLSQNNVFSIATSRLGVQTTTPNPLWAADFNGPIGGTFDGTNNGQIRHTFVNTDPNMIGYYAVYAP